MTSRALESIRSEWELVRATPRSRLAASRLCALEPAVERLQVADLGAIVATTSGELGAVPLPVVHEVIGALVRQFACDELLGIALVRVLVPGLVAVARSMRWGAGGPWNDRGEFETDLVAAAWRSAHAHAGRSLERPCRTMLEQARRSLRTDVERHRRETARRRPADALDELAASETDHLTELAKGLAQLAGSVIPERDAALLLANRVHGYRLSELAELSGESVAQLSYRRRRAESAVYR